MLLDHDFLEKWEKIVTDVDKDHCPITCVKKVVFRHKDKSRKTINLRRLRSQGIDDDSIERAVGSYIEEHDDNILNMELVLDVEAVAGIVQPQTDELLKGI